MTVYLGPAASVPPVPPADDLAAPYCLGLAEQQALAQRYAPDQGPITDADPRERE